MHLVPIARFHPAAALVASAAFALALSSPLAADGECATEWLTTFPAAPGISLHGASSPEIRAFLRDGNSDSAPLIAGGSFVAIGGVPAGSVARWDGSAWTALGEGMPWGVRALARMEIGSDTMIFAGGTFAMADGAPALRVAMWDGTNWSPLGAGVDGHVNSLAVFDDGGGPALYAAGLFLNAGGVPANRIARWDGSAWSPLDSGLDAPARVLTVHDDGSGPALYVGGAFTTAGGVAAAGIARWDGDAWSAVGAGIDPTVTALLSVTDDTPDIPAGLYAAEEFTEVVARWDGNQWTPLPGLSGGARALAVVDHGGERGATLYAAGLAGGTAMTGRVARWTGVTWEAVAVTAADVDIYALIGFSADSSTRESTSRAEVEDLFVGGDFQEIDAMPARQLVRYDGTRFRPVGGGINGDVLGSAVFDDGNGAALYIVGEFTEIDGLLVNRIARWDGRSWSAVGGGLTELPAEASSFSSDRVSAYRVVVHDDGSGPALFVNGWFRRAGGVEVNRIARWDGQAWSSLGSGLVGGSLSNLEGPLLSHDDGLGSGPALYTGGSFNTAGGVPAQRIARWDGTSWSALGSGFDQTVHALATFDDGSGPLLIAGGQFTVAGGVAVSRIAAWNGFEWSPLGAGVGCCVRSLSPFDDHGTPALAVGGTFNTAGGMPSPRLAKWDGQAWSALNNGFSPTAFAALLSVVDSGGGPALHTAINYGGPGFEGLYRWDGQMWSVIPGSPSSPRTLAEFDDGTSDGPTLYVGGRFTYVTDGDGHLARRAVCTPEDPTPADLNGDGIVDGADLGILLAAWGTCERNEDCPADLNGDGIVDGADLGMLLAAWSDR